MLYTLILTDWSAENDALIGVIRGAPKRIPPDSDCFSGNQNPFGVQPVQDLTKSLAFFADQIPGRDRKPVDEQFVRVDTFAAHLFDFAHGDERSVKVGVKKAQSFCRFLDVLKRGRARQQQDLVGLLSG